MSMMLRRPAEVWRRSARLFALALTLPVAWMAVARAVPAPPSPREPAPASVQTAQQAAGRAPAPAGDLTLDEIIDKHVAARGGLARIAAIQSLMLTGRIQFNPEVEAPITVRIRRPNQIRQDFIIQTRTGSRAYDGAVGWQRMPGPSGGPTAVELLRDAELKNIQDEAESAIDGPLLNYRARGHRVELVGKELFEQKPCFVLKVTLRSGHVLRQYLDAATFLEIGERLSRAVNGKETEIESTIGDYREAGGVLFPHLFVSGTADHPRESRLQFEKIVVNPALDEMIFKAPISPVAAR
jgi:hypothetical protein